MRNALTSIVRQSLQGLARISPPPVKPVAIAVFIAVLGTSGAAMADRPPYPAPAQPPGLGRHEREEHNVRPHWKRHHIRRVPPVMVVRPPVTHYYYYEPAPVIVTPPPPPPSGLSLIVPLYFR